MLLLLSDTVSAVVRVQFEASPSRVTSTTPARATAITVVGGMLAEPFTSFVFSTLNRAYLDFKLRFSFKDPLWDGTEEMPEEELMRAA